LTLAAVRRSASDNAERQYLKNALRLHQGRIKDTARAAGISPRMLHKLMAKHGLRKEDFKSGSCPQSDS
jgi:DNA-binding NtrC family response regulator